MNTRRLALVALVVAAGLGLAGCAAAGSPSPAASAAQGPGGNGFGGGQGGPGGKGGGAFPGAAGLVAAVSGSTAQVQSPTRQTAVTWTSTTSFTKQVTAASTDLKAGDCVVARPAAPSGTGTNGGSKGSGGSNSGGGATTVAAATIEMSAPVDGACTAGFGANRPGQRPSGAPTAAPGTGNGNGNGNGSTRTPRGFGAFGAVGTITSVSDGSLVVAERRGNSTHNVTVTWASSTTFTKLQAGAASDVVVGVCVLAQGKTDDTGALTATTIAVSPAVNGTCTTGFGGRGGGQGVPDDGATPGTGTGSGGKNA